MVFEREGRSFGFAPGRPGTRARRPTAREYTVCIHANEGGASGYWVDIPAVPGIVTGGETVAQALRHARDALRVHLEWLGEDGEPLPRDREPKRGGPGKRVVMQKVRVALAPR